MTAQTDTLIEISGLKFSYNSLDVLKGLDLAVPRGRIVAIGQEDFPHKHIPRLVLSN